MGPRPDAVAFLAFAVVALRTAHREGTVVWTKGCEGAPHRPSPRFERVRGPVGTGGGLRGVVSPADRDW